MYKDITFLDDVTTASRQNLLNFVKDWYSNKSFIEVKSSGSTGKPKTIKLEKTKIKVSIKATENYFNLKPDDTILLPMSIDYIGGKMMLLRAIEIGLKVIVANPKANPLLQIDNQNIDFSAFVPMQVDSILKNDITRLKYQKIKQVIIGGAPISVELENEIKTLKNLNFATFGMTETISHIAVRNINAEEDHYTCLNHVKISVDHDNCLKIESDELLNEPIQTNDIVRLINENQFIWKGRADFVINSGGVKLHPEEIEKKIESLIPNNRFYLTSQKDERLGEKLVLKIESENEISYIEFSKKLQLILTKFEMPKEIITVNQFNTTKSGKIIRD
jgi:O-succinylbenzoic acid--CoA ligase